MGSCGRSRYQELPVEQSTYEFIEFKPTYYSTVRADDDI